MPVSFWHDVAWWCASFPYHGLFLLFFFLFLFWNKMVFQGYLVVFLTRVCNHSFLQEALVSFIGELNGEAKIQMIGLLIDTGVLLFLGCQQANIEVIHTHPDICLYHLYIYIVIDWYVKRNEFTPIFPIWIQHPMVFILPFSFSYLLHFSPTVRNTIPIIFNIMMRPRNCFNSLIKGWNQLVKKTIKISPLAPHPPFVW